MSWSPFLHVHLDAHDGDHHAGHTIHAHVAGHDDVPRPSPGDPRFDGDAHERTMAVQLFVAVSPGNHATPSLPVSPWTPVAPLRPGPRTRPLVAHAHDPPTTRLLPARAPPRLSVLI